MKQKLLLVACLLLCGCEEARVLSHDGSKQIAYCEGDEHWIQCIHDACPNGFDIVEPGHPSEYIIRCKE